MFRSGVLIMVYGLTVAAQQGRPAEPTVEEVTALCRKIEASMKKDDHTVLSSAIDADALTGRVLKGLKLSDDTRKALQLGFLKQDLGITTSCTMNLKRRMLR